MAARVTRYSRLVITVPRWIAEPFGAALVELGAGAVEDASSDMTDDEDHRGSSSGSAPAELRVSLPEDESADAWESAAKSLYAAFAESLPLPADGLGVRTETVDDDYHAAWLARLTAQQLTDRIWFVPVSQRSTAPIDARCLLFEPHPSFGDGSHPTTRLAARAVETFCSGHQGCTVLDVGTGNGVLSLVAAAAGANSLGLDIDGGAIDAARQNAELNHLEQQVRFETSPLETVGERFDLVVANVEPLTHLALREHLVPRLAANGQLVLTGFLTDQVELIAEPLRALGLLQTSGMECEGYHLLTFAHAPTPPEERR